MIIGKSKILSFIAKTVNVISWFSVFNKLPLLLPLVCFPPVLSFPIFDFPFFHHILISIFAPLSHFSLLFLSAFFPFHNFLPLPSFLIPHFLHPILHSFLFFIFILKYLELFVFLALWLSFLPSFIFLQFSSLHFFTPLLLSFTHFLFMNLFSLLLSSFLCSLPLFVYFISLLHPSFLFLLSSQC